MWCYGCDAYLDVYNIATLQPAYSALHTLKFGAAPRMPARGNAHAATGATLRLEIALGSNAAEQKQTAQQTAASPCAQLGCVSSAEVQTLLAQLTQRPLTVSERPSRGALCGYSMFAAIPTATKVNLMDRILQARRGSALARRIPTRSAQLPSLPAVSAPPPLAPTPHRLVAGALRGTFRAACMT